MNNDVIEHLDEFEALQQIELVIFNLPADLNEKENR